LDDQPAPSAPTLNAGLARRLGSLCYETLLLAALLFISGGAFLFMTRSLDPAFARPLFQLYLLAVTAAYFVYCWTHGGQTLPMQTWRIRLVTRGGSAISPPTGICRYLFAVLGLGLCGLGLVWALVDRERQFLHDRLAGTRIVSC
jgi:uncharacterized RDD family membrane protein YckC